MKSAVLSARRDAGGGLLILSLDVEAELARAYTTPGQYIKVTMATASGYFVLTARVGTSPWELLVKKGAGDAADALEKLPLGSAVPLDGPRGDGFPQVRAVERPVVVAVVGSALGVARAVIEERIAAGAASTTRLFLGVRSPAELPIEAELASWSGSGVEVVLCLSKSELHHHDEVLPQAKRFAGYVQHTFARALEAGTIPGGALVVVAGPDAMLAEMRALASGASAASGASGASGTTLEVVSNV